MPSAFGVEHGDEFSKFAMPKIGGGTFKPVTGLGAKMGSGASSLGRKASASGAQRMKGVAGAGSHRAAGGFSAGLGRTQVGAGSGLRRAGAAMSAHPGATGGAVLGAGAVGGTSFMAGRNNRRY